MFKQRVSAKVSVYSFVLFVWVLLIGFQAAFCKEAGAISTEEALVNQVVKQWLAVAKEQYKRSLYIQAEKSISRAQEYSEYLNDDTRSEINSLLVKNRRALSQKQVIINSISTAKELMKQDKLIQAKAHLTEVKKSKLLSETEKQYISATLKTIDQALKITKKEMAQIFAQSKKYYLAGDFYNAQKGFTLVAKSGMYVPKKGMTAEDYLIKIGRISADKKILSLLAPTKVAMSMPSKTEGKKNNESIVDIVRPIQESSVKNRHRAGLIGNVGDLTNNTNSKQRLKQSYITAVVKDTREKVMLYIGQGQFRRAREKIESTENLLEENRIEVGEEFYQQSYNKIKKLSIKMAKQEDFWLRTKSTWKK